MVKEHFFDQLCLPQVVWCCSTLLSVFLEMPTCLCFGPNGEQKGGDAYVRKYAGEQEGLLACRMAGRKKISSAAVLLTFTTLLLEQMLLAWMPYKVVGDVRKVRRRKSL